jgi:hypothetical protein
MDLQGSFFPSAQAVCNRKLLDVNKIHFLLASVNDERVIVDEIFRALDEHRAEFQLESNESYYKRLAHASRYDNAEIIFIKRALQVGLPSSVRELITNHLFKKYVSADEAGFAAELYMSIDQIRCMARHGMYIGSHGYDHSWLGQLTPEEQCVAIDRSLEFLGRTGADLDAWIMCFPYGDFSESLLRILKARNCAVGLTTQVEIATSEIDPLLLPRLNTNDLPKQANAPPNAWTARVIRGWG